MISPEDASADLRALCRRAPVVPVLVIAAAERAVPLAEALAAGGITILEITLRSEAALPAIRALRDLPEVRVGAGSLRRPSDIEAAVAAGARFGVAPGATPALLDAAESAGMPLLPGAMTPSEMMTLLHRGYDLQKFFPAQVAGGTDFLRAIAGPLPEVAFCPTGGISRANVGAYLAEPNVLCVGGSWLAPNKLVAEGQWDRITALASEAAALPGSIEGGEGDRP